MRLVVARAVYKDPETQEITTVDKPKEILERGLLAPSMIAHLLVSKYRFGIPFHRLTEMFRAEGIRLEDGLMCRYAEHVGATLGCIVLAMAKEAKETAFCLSTDATGVCIQPLPRTDGKRQACAKGHFFVVLGGVAGSCDVGWVGGESEVVEDVTDELGIADVREDGAGSSAGTGEDVVEVDALDKRSPVHAAGPRREESGAEAGFRAAPVRQLGRIRGSARGVAGVLGGRSSCAA